MRCLLMVLLTCLSLPAWAGGTTAFVNVNVVPMDKDGIVSQQTVVVRDGAIVAVGPVDDVPIPEDAHVVDGTDRYLLPGLAEMHAHVPDANTPEMERYFALYVANGVTTIRGMLGRPSHLELREDLATGRTFGPRLVTSGPSLNGRSVNGAEQARQMVRAQHAAGYDFIKIHPGLSRDEFEAAAATANELDMPFAGHVPVAVGVRRALQLGIATIDHLDGYFAELLPKNSDGEGGYGGFFGVFLADDIDPEQLASIARETAAAGTWNVPTEVLVEQLVDTTPVAELRSRPEMRYMPEETVEGWADAKREQLAERGYDPGVAMLAVELRRRLIIEMHRAGAGLLLGSDSPQIFNVPGFATHRELDALVAAGLSPYEALRTGTAAVAEFLGTNTGIVAVGRDADLVLLDADPLEDITNARRVHGVVVRGEWYPATELDERIAPYRRGRQ